MKYYGIRKGRLLKLQKISKHISSGLILRRYIKVQTGQKGIECYDCD